MRGKFTSDAGRAAGLILLLAVLGACDSGTGPEPVEQYRHRYVVELAASSAADTVLLQVGTNISLPDNVDTTAVFLDIAPAEEGAVRLGVHVLGLTYDPDDRAVVDHRWRGDTLQVWCGFMTPQFWGPGRPLDKTSYPPPWFMPERIDVQLPAGAVIRYVGRWFE